MSTTTTQPLGAGDGRRERLRQLLAAEALITGREMTLASGRTSNLYFNVKKPLFDPECASLIADEILARLAGETVDYVGGMALGAVPIVAAVCARSFPGQPIRGFFVRKDVKEYGTQNLIEGYFEPDARVVLFEDVTTTGGSTLQAAKTVRAASGHVAKAITVIDRLEGARKNLAAEGIDLVSLFTKDDFGDFTKS
ncbi:MAG: orotate phosphoribosyltransferase [Rhodospirillales bacterium]|nr:orotate phosphoribosyltransferase [Rhodospirillales bacterium]